MEDKVWQLFQCEYAVNVPISSRKLLGSFKTKALAQETNAAEIWCGGADGDNFYRTKPQLDTRNSYVKFFLVETRRKN